MLSSLYFLHFLLFSLILPFSSSQSSLLIPSPSSLKPPSLPYHSIQLYGNFTLGYYYATLYIGTPAQKQSFIIDTGSTIFAIPCNMCTSCGLRHMNPKFDVTRSNTSRMVTCEEGFCRCERGDKNNSCKFKVSYAEGSSLNGVMVEDVVVFEQALGERERQDKKAKEVASTKDQSQPKIQSNQSQLHHQYQSTNQSVRAVFGCITEQTHLFLSQKADGILGLGPIQISNILQQLKIQHSPTSNQSLSFSICYADNGGIFTIGGTNPNLKSTNPITIKYRQNNGRYSLGIDDILVGNKSLNLTTLDIFSGEGIVVDSGATYTYFEREYYKIIVKEIDSVCEELGCSPYTGEDSKCYHFPTQYNSTPIALQDQLSKFPSIDIKHGSSYIKWSALDYFLVRNELKRQVCLGFLEFRSWILGGTWMVGREINFNLDKKEVVLSDSRCSYDENYVPPKFHRMYAGDRSPLTDLFLEMGDGAFLAVLMIGIVIIVLCLVVIATLRVMKKQRMEKKGINGGIVVESIEMIEEHEEQLDGQ